MRVEINILEIRKWGAKMFKVNIDFIKKRRQEMKLTQLEMAKKLGLKSAPSYLMYEKGSYEFKAEMMPIIADVLGCDLKELYIFLSK